MLNYVKALVGMKLGQKGALFVEYALILAFVIVVGVAFLNSDGSLAGNIKSIFDNAESTVKTAASQAASAS